MHDDIIDLTRLRSFCSGLEKLNQNLVKKLRHAEGMQSIRKCNIILDYKN